MALVAAGGVLIGVSIYDAIKIANDERPSEFWAYSQGVIAPPLAFALGYEAADSAEVETLNIAFAGWLAALGGFAIGSLGVDRTRSGGVGAAMGFTAASAEHAALTLSGRAGSKGGFIVQMLYAAPGVAAGANWALDAASTADLAGGLTLASVASVSMLHGFTAYVAEPDEASTSARGQELPRLALGCSPSHGQRCTLAVSGTW